MLINIKVAVNSISLFLQFFGNRVFCLSFSFILWKQAFLSFCYVPFFCPYLLLLYCSICYPLFILLLCDHMRCKIIEYNNYHRNTLYMMIFSKMKELIMHQDLSDWLHKWYMTQFLSGHFKLEHLLGYAVVTPTGATA